MNKNLKRMWALILLMAMCIASFAGCGQAAKKVTFELPELGDEVTLHTELQNEWIATQNSFWILKYVDGLEDKSHPEPVHFSFTTESDYPEEDFKGYKLSVFEDEALTKLVKEVETTETAVDMYNLKIGTKYYWNVTATYGDQTYTSGTANFTTEAIVPRNLKIEGITNVRDLGGHLTTDGKVTKQGLLYRCGRMNEDGTTDVMLTEEGMKEYRDYIGIKCEIDFRYSGDYGDENGYITESVLGPHVNYISVPMDQSDFLTDWPNALENYRVCFEALSDESNYPACFHCSIGTDRTGIFAFLCLGLLGVEEDEIYRDYVFSDFGYIGGTRSPMDAQRFLRVVKKYGGDTLQERIENYLLKGCGVPQEQIDKFKEIMLEDAPENFVTTRDRLRAEGMNK